MLLLTPFIPTMPHRFTSTMGSIRRSSHSIVLALVHSLHVTWMNANHNVISSTNMMLCIIGLIVLTLEFNVFILNATPSFPASFHRFLRYAYLIRRSFSSFQSTLSSHHQIKRFQNFDQTNIKFDLGHLQAHMLICANFINSGI